MDRKWKLERRATLKGMAIAMAAPALLLRTGTAASAGFPDRPVKVVISTTPGGTLDQVARIMSEKMMPHLGQPLVVEYRPGASGTVAANAVKNAPRDGHTIFFGAGSALGYQKLLEKDLPYDPVKDFTPVAMVGSVPVVIFTTPATGFNSIQDLLAAAKAKPGEISYGSVGPLTLPHLAAELLQYRAGISMIHAPYAGSSGRYWTDLLGGRLQLVFTGASGGMGLVKDGKLKMLAVASRERSRLLPDVPALGEVFPGLDVPAWFAFSVAAGTPAPIVKRLEEATLAALRDPSTRQAFAQIGVDIDPILGSRESEVKIRADNETWEKVFKAAGLVK